MGFKDVEGEGEKVVVVQSEALLLLVEIAVEDDVLGALGLFVLFPQGVQGEGDEIQVVVGAVHQLFHLDHVPRRREGHVPQGEPTLVVDELEHGVDIAVVQHQKALGVLHGVAVLLENGYAEAVEGVDVAGVVVAGEGVDPLAHLQGGLVGEGDAENVPWENAHLLHQVGKAPGERPGLAGARAGHHPDKALGGRHRLALGVVEGLQQLHARSSFF